MNPEKSGCVFSGWYNSSLNSKFDFNTKITSNVTLYAKWTEIQGTYIKNSNYEVKLETGKAYSETFTFASIPYSDFESIDEIVIELSDTSKGLKVSNVSEYVCTVSGTPSSSGTVYLRQAVNGMLQSGEYGAVMYFVTYTISSPVCSVTFAANGGSGSVSSQTVQPGTEITLPQSGFTKTGHILAGWNLNSVSGTFYDIGSKYVVNSDVTFYADWISVTSGDHGAPLECKAGEEYSFIPDMQTSAWILYLEVSGNSYYEINYDGPEWLDQTGSKKQLRFEGVPLDTGVYLVSIYLTGPASGIENYSKQEWYITVTEDVPDSYTVSFDSNYGTGSVPSQTVLPNNAVILPSSGIMRSGYTLTGWCEGLLGPVYNLGSLYTVASDITFYAEWTADSNLVVFDANGGSGNITYIAATGDSVTLPSEGFVRDGYFLAGWILSDTVYSPGYVYLVSGAVTMYAYWSPVDSSYVTVTYNANGGSSSLSEQTVESGKTIALPSSGFNKAQSSLTGWNSSDDGSGVSYDIGEKVRVVSDVTFYAQWEEASENVTVTFSLNGGSGSVASQTVHTGDVISKPSDPVRDGYIFTSWRAVGGSEWDFNNPVTESMTLIAQWQQHFTLSVNYLIINVTVSKDYAGLIHTVDWGDGVTETKTGSTFSHTYDSASAGRIVITTALNDQKSVSSGLPYNLTDEEIHTVTFVYEDKITKVTVTRGSIVKVPDVFEEEAGWYLDKEFRERYEFLPVTSDITLYGYIIPEEDDSLLFIIVTIAAVVLSVLSAIMFRVKGIPLIIIIALGYAYIILEVL